MKRYIKSGIALFALLLVISGCTRDEVLLTGEIKGELLISDQYGQLLNSEGMEVAISNPSFSFQEAINEGGAFLFSDIPYGTYDVFIQKDGYIDYAKDPRIYHVGGYNPTIENFRLVEVPTFRMEIDSVAVASVYRDKVNIYGKFNSWEGGTNGGFYAWVFIGDTPEVSKDNYSEYISGYIMDNYITAQNFWFPALYYMPDSGTLYFRVYPQARANGTGVNRKETLGPASEVFMWNVE